MDRKIRIGAVSYLNTKPLLYGIRHSALTNKMELLLDYPSRIAGLLEADQIDIGLIPVAAIPALKEYHIVSDYCIGCDGPVASVCLFSEVPLEQVETVLLDYQSKTSSALTRILLKNYWRLSPQLTEAQDEDYLHRIKDRVAGLVIGDRALQQRRISTYFYDLGEAWKDFTGLNFVFAAWVSNKELDPSFLREFNEANAWGVEHIKEVIHENPYGLFDLEKYYRYYINYRLDERKRIGMEEFLFQLSQF